MWQYFFQRGGFGHSEIFAKNKEKHPVLKMKYEISN